MRDVRTVLADEPTDPDRTTVVVAISNPAHVEQLLRTAGDYARIHDGELLLVSVIHKPVTSPFLVFSGSHIEREFDSGQRELLDHAVSLAPDVPVRRQLLVSDNVSDALLSTMSDAEALFMGWQDKPRAGDVVLGTTVDPVVRKAPCDVFIERVGTTADGVDSILLPTVGGDRVKPAARLAQAIAKANNASVEVVSLVPPNGEESNYLEREQNVTETADLLESVPVKRTVTEAADIGHGVTTLATEHDLVVLGSTRERTIRRRVVGSVAEHVVHTVDEPVIVANQPTRLTVLSRLRGLFQAGISTSPPSENINQ